MSRTVEDLVSLVSAGASITILGPLYSKDALVRIASACAATSTSVRGSGHPRVRIAGADKFSQDALLEIARAGGGCVTLALSD